MPGPGLTRESNVADADRQRLRNLFRSAQRVVDSPTTSRASERSVLLAHVERAG
jgi:hypothetical protein